MCLVSSILHRLSWALDQLIFSEVEKYCPTLPKFALKFFGKYIYSLILREIQTIHFIIEAEVLDEVVVVST